MSSCILILHHVPLLAYRADLFESQIQVGGSFRAPVGDPDSELHTSNASIPLHLQEGLGEVVDVWDGERANIAVRPRRPSELSSEALARSVEKFARMNRKLARELPIT